MIYNLINYSPANKHPPYMMYLYCNTQFFEYGEKVIEIIDKLDLSSVIDLKKYKNRKFDGDLHPRIPMLLTQAEYYKLYNYIIEHIKDCVGIYAAVDLANKIIESLLREYNVCMDEDLVRFFRP